MIKKVLFVGCLVLASIAVLVACNPATTTVKQTTPTTGTSTANGFTFTANVSNTNPKLGDSVNISVALTNESNTGLTIPDLGGSTTIEVKNEAGQVVWGIVHERSATTLTSSPLPIGWQFNSNPTWVVKTDPTANIPVVAGKYFINVSDTGYYDSASGKNVPFSLNPIEVDVTN